MDLLLYLMANERRGAVTAEVLTDSCQAKKMSAVHQPLNLSLWGKPTRKNEVRQLVRNLSVKGHSR